MSKKEKGISMPAAFVRATTLIDGGWNITFTVDETNVSDVTELTKLRGVLLQLAVIPIEDNP